MFDHYNQFKQPYLPASTWLPWNDSALKGVNLRWFKILWARSIIITKWIYRKERYEPNSRFFYLYEVKSWQNYSIDPLEKEKESKKINNRKILNRLHNFDLHTPIDRSYNESQKLISIDYRTFMTQLEKRLWSLFTTSNGRARKVLTAFTRTVESCPHRHR